MYPLLYRFVIFEGEKGLTMMDRREIRKKPQAHILVIGFILSSSQIWRIKGHITKTITIHHTMA